MYSAIKKNALLIFPWSLIAIYYAVVSYRFDLIPLLFLLDVWLLSHPHSISTYFKSEVFNVISRKSLFILGAGFALLFYLTAYKFGLVVLFNVYFFTQWFHYMRQNYGIANHYSKKKDYLGWGLLHVAPLIALGALATYGGLDFLGFYIYLPSVPEMTFDYFFLAYVLLFLAAIVHERNNREYVRVIASHFFSYGFVFFGVKNFVVGWIALTIYHNVQYLIFNHRYGVDGVLGKSFTKFYFVTLLVSAGAYGIFKIGMGNFLVFAIPLSLIGTLALNFTHYFYDSFVWKGRKKAKLRSS